MDSPFSVKIPSSGSLLASTSYTNEIPYPDLIRSMIILKLEIHRYFMGRVDAPLAVVRPSQNPDLRLSRIRLFAKRIVHIYQLYTLTYIRGLTNG